VKSYFILIFIFLKGEHIKPAVSVNSLVALAAVAIGNQKYLVVLLLFIFLFFVFFVQTAPRYGDGKYPNLTKSSALKRIGDGDLGEGGGG